MITKPELEPKAGYVEVEVGGVHQYKNIETGEITLKPTQPPTIESLMKELEESNAKLTESNEKLTTLDGTLTDLMINVVPSLTTT